MSDVPYHVGIRKTEFTLRVESVFHIYKLRAHLYFGFVLKRIFDKITLLEEYTQKDLHSPVQTRCRLAPRQIPSYRNAISTKVPYK